MLLGYAGEHELALSRCLRVPRATLRDRARRYTSCVGCINAVHLLPLDRAHPLLEDVLDEDGRVHAVRLRDVHASSMDKVGEALLSGEMMDSMWATKLQPRGQGQKQHGRCCAHSRF